MFQYYNLWESHVSKMTKERNELGLMLSLKNEKLDFNESLSKEVLILIDDNYNCNLYYS